MHRLDRRGFLSALPLLAGTGLVVADVPDAPRLIPRQRNPDNLEFPFHSLKDFLTPNDLFYVRNHFPAPRLGAKSWRLQVAGAVERPLELSLAQLQEMPSRTMPMTLECAGNGRAFLVPLPKGVIWHLGAVSTAEWTGVPLASVLQKAGVRPSAVEVVLEGADRGEPATDPKPPGTIHFARSLPLGKARRPEMLLAWAMNGKELSPDHGFPLRAVAGGWYGMAAVKWLTRVVVVERPFRGYWQTVDYAVWKRRGDEPSLEPITEMDVKSSIARPAAGAVLAAGSDHEISGAAWGGESDVVGVEVSTDGGRTWSAASLQGRPVPFAWRLWSCTWQRPAPGEYVLMARATDRRGRVQAMRRDPDRRNYMISHILPTPIEVR
jgi:DMSO/TMAO reductase YedYZ molybdopterin-dependent catalytic subunit